MTVVVNQPFSSEALLQQAVAGLLTRMPDISGVQILHGTQEYGKDVVFYIRGGFNERVLCACVIKNAKITGDASATAGARNVFLQAQQAFDTPHVDSAGREVFVERVYVVTPFDLPPPTIASIKGLLRDRAGQIVFIGGPELFDAFKRYWPDFFADEADVLQRHLIHTSKRFEEDNPLDNLASLYHLGSIDPNYKKIYVPQLFQRQLNSFSWTRTFLDAVPKEVTLTRDWTQGELWKVRKGLIDFKVNLSLLAEWGFLSESKRVQISDGTTTLNAEVEKAWRLGLKKQRRSQGLSENAKVTDAETVFLHNSRKLILQSLVIQDYVKASLEPLNEGLALLHDIVDAPPTVDAGSLSYEEFRFICAVNECAPHASDIWEKYKSRTVSLPKNIHNIWGGSLMIVGAPGYGKTSFCRWHALQDAERFMSGHSKTLPVYIPLHRLGTGKLGSFEKTFLASVGESALISSKFDRLATDVRFRIYLDGLDEVPSRARREEIIALAKDHASTNERYQIILTARDHIEGSWLTWMPRISLSGFDNTEIINLVSRWLGKDTIEAKQFYEQLGVTPTLANLMRTPLLATLIILLFRQTGRLPESKTKLYDVFLDLLFGGWDTAKGILRESKYGSRIKMMTLATLASNLHEAGKREFSDSEFRRAFKAVFAESKAISWEGLRDELIEDGVIGKSGALSQFSHLSFQEFLTAKSFMADPQPKRVRKALAAFLSGKSWWREVLRFYIGLSSKPREITLWLLAEIDRIANAQTVGSEQTNDLLTGVAEAFPEYPIEDLIDLQTRSQETSSARAIIAEARRKMIGRKEGVSNG